MVATTRTHSRLIQQPIKHQRTAALLRIRTKRSLIAPTPGHCASFPSICSRCLTSGTRKFRTRSCSSVRHDYREGPLGRYYNEARELARLVTRWSDSLPHEIAPVRGVHRRWSRHYGGGESRRTAMPGGKTIGLNIGLPFEQWPNPYITPDLSFEFHYFFMRKFWFAYLAKALVVFPGGFGTLDELIEILTLAQTQKLESKITLVLYGSQFWNEVMNFEAL